MIAILVPIPREALGALIGAEIRAPLGDELRLLLGRTLCRPLVSIVQAVAQVTVVGAMARSTHDLGVCSNSYGRSGGHIAHQATFSAYSEIGTKNPEDILFPGTAQKRKFASGTSRETRTSSKEINTARMSLSTSR